MMEVLAHYQKKIESSKILSELGLENLKYFVVSCHREENVNDYHQFMKFIDVLNLLATKYSLPIIVSTHPRTRKQIEKHNVKVDELVIFSKPMCFSDYNALQLNSYVVLSDSGTISEESSIMNFPALNIRESHERPEAMEEAAVMLVGLNSERVIQGIEEVKNQDRKQRQFQIVRDYSFINVSDKVVRIIISYIDYIKRNSWGTAHEGNSN
jgi:UDP-N-acetylglucosamine 2-epimerase (non-hydrolysing)